MRRARVHFVSFVSLALNGTRVSATAADWAAGIRRPRTATRWRCSTPAIGVRWRTAFVDEVFLVVTRRDVLLASGFCLFAAHRPGQGQPTATIRHVGWVSLGSKASPAEAY